MQEEMLRTSIASPAPPVIPDARIEALDVVRGFALFGIFLMNIEFFNRSLSGLGEGMPLGLTGIDWLASWFIAYFVQGKFWTIFSLLFGMGFAVMLTRAERAGRPFLAPYLRRILGLAVFGAAHYIFLWAGDILFSYAVGAGALLILLYGTWKPILLALLALVLFGLVTGLDQVYGIAVGLSFVAWVSMYIRDEKRTTVRGFSLPRLSMLFLVFGVVALLAAIVLWSLVDGPKEPRVPVSVVGVILLLLSVLSTRFKDPTAARELRLGVALYTVPLLIMTAFGAAQYLRPEPTVASLAGTQSVQSVQTAAEKTETEKAAQKKAERDKRLVTRQENIAKEVRILSSGSYLEAVEMRARQFPEKVAGDAGFATLLIAVFLLGSWFVRSGVMENTGAHLPLFRKLAVYGLPIGIGMGLLGSMVAVSHIPGDNHDGFQFARGLAMLGNLPASVGYVGLVVLMLHSPSFFSRIRVLAPVGRMALTNYLLQSFLCATYFYGYGLGQWGMGRALQVVFVVCAFAVQIALSHWWLARYRFGPMEWLWRAFTYRTTPQMQR